MKRHSTPSPGIFAARESNRYDPPCLPDTQEYNTTLRLLNPFLSSVDGEATPTTLDLATAEEAARSGSTASQRKENRRPWWTAAVGGRSRSLPLTTGQGPVSLLPGPSQYPRTVGLLWPIPFLTAYSLTLYGGVTWMVWLHG